MRRLFGLIEWDDLCDFFYCFPAQVLKLFCKLFFIDTDKIVLKMAEKWVERNTRIITLKNGFKVFEEMKPIPYFYKAYRVERSYFSETTGKEEKYPISIICVANGNLQEKGIKFTCVFDDKFKKKGVKLMTLHTDSNEADINLMRAHPVRFFDYIEEGYLYFIPSDDDEVRRIAEECCDPSAELNYEKGEILHEEALLEFLHQRVLFYRFKDFLLSLFKLLFAYDLRESLIRECYDEYKNTTMIVTLGNGCRILKMFYPGFCFGNTYSSVATIEKLIAEEKPDFVLVNIGLYTVSEDKSLRERVDFRRIDKNIMIPNRSKDWFVIIPSNNRELAAAVEEGFLPEAEVAHNMEK